MSSLFFPYVQYFFLGCLFWLARLFTSSRKVKLYLVYTYKKFYFRIVDILFGYFHGIPRENLHNYWSHSDCVIRVAHDTVENTMAFLCPDWLYYLCHSKKKILQCNTIKVYSE